MGRFFAFLVIVLTHAVHAQTNTNMVIATNGKLTIDSSWVLTVEGAITNNGEVIIKDGSSLIQTHSGVDANTNNGSYNVRRVGGSSTSAYNIWSSPVQNDSISGSGGVFLNSNPCDIYTYNGSTQAWKYDFPIGFSGNCNGSIVTFNANQVITDATPDNRLDPMRGYFVPGNPTSERIFKGDINNGQLQTNIYYTTITNTDWNGTNWNLVGNPYPSSVVLSSFWTTNAGSGVISDGIYFWNDPGSTPYDQCNDYIVWNPVGTASSCGASSTSATSGVVSSGQGFWVYAAGSGTGTASLTFDNSMRTSAENSNFYKQSHDFERVWISVSRNNRVSNQILLGLKDDATVGYDPLYDARKLPGSGSFELAFVQDSGIYVILAQPTISYQEQEELPLYLNTDSAGIHIFAFDSMQNVIGGNKYYLIDKVLNITHDLSSPYQVQLAAGEYQNRFYLLYTDMINNVNEGTLESNFVTVSLKENQIGLKSSKVNIKEVSVYNTLGQLFMNINNINHPQINLPTNALAAGVYLINYTLTNGYSDTEKVVIAY